MSDVGGQRHRAALGPPIVTTARGALAACHLQPTVAVTGFTTALAVSAGCGRRSFAMGAAVLCGQLAVGWSNDYIDRDRDAAAGRLDKPIVVGTIEPALVRNCAIAAAVASVPLSMRCGRGAAAVHLAAVGAGLAYNARLKSTPFSVAPYAVAFGALPAFVTLSAPGRRLPPGWTTVAAALLGAGAHFVNVLPDVEADEIGNVRGLPQRLGPVHALHAGIGLIASSTAVIAVFGGRPTTAVQRALITASAGTVAAVFGAARTGRTRLAWSLSLVSAGAAVALCIAKRPLRSVT